VFSSAFSFDDSFLFRYAKPDATQEEIETAAKVGIHLIA
jgi:hypothetical protein